EEISQTVGATRNNAKLVERILAVYQTPGASVARAFREALQVIFEGTELLIADAADPAIKRASVGVLRTALVDAQHHEDVLARRSHEIEAAGFQAQVNILPGSTNVFHHSEA